MAANPYHLVSYPTVPMAQTHPDRLASVATLFGMSPTPITNCRVLEIGCGTGGNLIPMASYLPGSRFIGIDLAEAPVLEGRAAVAELDLSNIELLAMDLCDVGPEMGDFDYILAHGLYSWIPDPIRDRVLALCRARLTPQGVAFISYNALPGRHVRLMFRDMIVYHTRDISNPTERIDRARNFLRTVGESALASAAWQPMLEEEIASLLSGNPGWLYHDDLSPINDSFYFRDFAARAARHGLQYLGDAEAHLMFDIKNKLGWVGDDILEREQYLDFLSFRRFRQTLLCRDDVSLQRPAAPHAMDRFSFSSPARESENQIEGHNKVCITDPPESVARVVSALADAYPLPVAFNKLRHCTTDPEALRNILFALIGSGFAEFHVHDFASAVADTPRPSASRLARWEAAHNGIVTYANHTVLKLDPSVRALIDFLDGTRTLDELAAALSKVEGAPPLEDIRDRLPDILNHMARTGLLQTVG